MVKEYECAICKDLTDNQVKGQKRFIGTRKAVREHLVNEHHLSKRRNPQGIKKSELGPSEVSKCTLRKER